MRCRHGLVLAVCMLALLASVEARQMRSTCEPSGDQRRENTLENNILCRFCSVSENMKAVKIADVFNEAVTVFEQCPESEYDAPIEVTDVFQMSDPNITCSFETVRQFLHMWLLALQMLEGSDYYFDNPTLGDVIATQEAPFFMGPRFKIIGTDKIRESTDPVQARSNSLRTVLELVSTFQNNICMESGAEPLGKFLEVVGTLGNSGVIDVSQVMAAAKHANLLDHYATGVDELAVQAFTEKQDNDLVDKVAKIFEDRSYEEVKQMFNENEWTDYLDNLLDEYDVIERPQRDQMQRKIQESIKECESLPNLESEYMTELSDLETSCENSVEQDKRIRAVRSLREKLEKTGCVTNDKPLVRLQCPYCSDFANSFDEYQVRKYAAKCGKDWQDNSEIVCEILTGKVCSSSYQVIAKRFNLNPFKSKMGDKDTINGRPMRKAGVADVDKDAVWEQLSGAVNIDHLKEKISQLQDPNSEESQKLTKKLDELEKKLPSDEEVLKQISGWFRRFRR